MGWGRWVGRSGVAVWIREPWVLAYSCQRCAREGEGEERRGEGGVSDARRRAARRYTKHDSVCETERE